MPAIIALGIRAAIQFGITLGITDLATKYALPLINNAIAWVIEKFGVSEEDAQAYVANSFLTFAEQVGIGALTIRSRLPIVLSDALGFSSKGFAARKLSIPGAEKLKSVLGVGAVAAEATAADIPEIAAAVAKSRGLTVEKVNTVVSLVLKIVLAPVGVFYAAAQYMDYAAWQNPYQKTFEKILSNFGVEPDTHMPSAKTISQDTWNRVNATIEVLKPISINYPFSDKTAVYSQKALAEIVDEIATNIVKGGGQATYKNVMGLVLPLIHIEGGATAAPATGTTPVSGVAAAPSSGGAGSISQTPTVKVFTGLLSSGTLGNQPAFVPRESGLIESGTELAQDAQQEAASFLAALPGSIIYEVRIVNYVIANDGTRRSGTVQRVQTGTYKNGTAKYRILRNKFAVLDLYFHTVANTRTKLAELIIGPVDVANFNPTPADLATLTGSLKGQVSTNNLSEIKAIISANPVATTAPTTSAPTSTLVSAQTTPQTTSTGLYQVEKSGTPEGYEVIYYPPGKTPDASLLYPGAPAPSSSFPTWKPGSTVAASSSAPAAPAPIPKAVWRFDDNHTRVQKGSDGDVYVYNLPTTEEGGSTYSGPVSAAPTVAMGKLYEFLGLGPASTYVGNASQIARIDQLR